MWSIEGGILHGYLRSNWGTGSPMDIYSVLPRLNVSMEGLLNFNSLQLIFLATLCLAGPFLFVYFISHKVLLINLGDASPIEQDRPCSKGSSATDSELKQPTKAGSSRDSLPIMDRVNVAQLLDPDELKKEINHQRRILLVTSCPELALKECGVGSFRRAAFVTKGIEIDAEKSPAPVLITQFAPELTDTNVGNSQLQGFEEILLESEQAIVILSSSDPRTLLAIEETEAPAASLQLRRGWVALLSSFLVHYAIDKPAGGEQVGRKENLPIEFLGPASAMNEVRERVKKEKKKSDAQESWTILQVLERECDPTRQLQIIGRQILEEVNVGSYVTFTAEKMIRRIGLRARSYYHAIWSSSTEVERMVMAQLAWEGLVNPKISEGVMSLIYRGLIVRDPALRLINKSFVYFIRETVSPATLLKWEADEGTSIWSILSWLLPLPLMLLGGFVFVTQRDAVSSAVGFLLAAASVTPTLLSLFGYFERRAVRTSSPGPGKTQVPPK